MFGFSVVVEGDDEAIPRVMTDQRPEATLWPILYKVPLSSFEPFTGPTANVGGHSSCLIKCSNKVRVNSEISNGLYREKKAKQNMKIIDFYQRFLLESMHENTVNCTD